MTNTLVRTDPHTGAELLLLDLSGVTTDAQALAIAREHLTPNYATRNGDGRGFTPTYRYRENGIRCQPEPVTGLRQAATSLLRHASHWDLDITPAH